VGAVAPWGEQTPIERHGGYLVKRDDTFEVGGSRGGKVRTCAVLVRNALEAGAPGVVTAGSRHSPQVNIVATLAHQAGLPCRVHVPAAKGGHTPELAAAAALGAEVIEHRPGYNSVIVSRAHADAQALGWAEVPFGMEHREAVRQTASQVASIRDLGARRWPHRIVVPVGSGMSCAGILTGLAGQGLTIPVLGVQVGADPRKRLARYAPGLEWRLELVPALQPYQAEAEYNALGSLDLDPIYEGKCLPFLRPGDLLWVVGKRASASGERRALRA
jgi:1-aminocyclopropane-1-carboxylate deaminase/D-cysteine desulfhydrase-like pyridoxal-dependent ACC family enzyme